MRAVTYVSLLHVGVSVPMQRVSVAYCHALHVGRSSSTGTP
jgi:hypothetical protein